MTEFYSNSIDWLSGLWDWKKVGFGAIRIFVIIIVCRFIAWLLNKTITRIVLENATKRTVNQARRQTTVGKLLKSISSYAIYFIGIMLILSEIGINLVPLLAGAGVVGIAIGFGAQSLVKDIITGFFIIMEDQFAVGDVIQTGKFKGTVEEIGLRTTKIVNWTGEVHTLPNSMILDVTNCSLNSSLAVVDVNIKNEVNADQAIACIKSTMGGLHSEDLIKEPEVLGIQAMTVAEMTIRVIAECRPNTQSEVSRLMYKRIKEALEEMAKQAAEEQQVAEQEGG